MSDGLYNFTAKSEDSAGNVSATSSQLKVTIDTVATVPTALDLLAESDSGNSNSDNITNTTTPAIAGKAEAGALVQLFSDGQPIGQTTATNNNTWSVATSQLADGTQTLTAITTDLAGNKSAVSEPLDVVIDTNAPTTPIGLRLTAATDTGSSNSDNITSNTTPTITGSGEAGALIELFKGEQQVGQTTATADGDWLLTVELLSNGQHTFTTKAVDIAGNVSASSGQLVVRIEPSTDNSITQAIAQINGLDPYPDAVTLVSGTTRQLSVKLNGLPDSPNLTTGSTGTQYAVSHPEVVSVSPDGLITALKQGTATITVSYGEAEVEVPVRVATPQSGAVTLGVDGGVVQASNGATVAIAPGALEENTTVSLTPLSLENLSLPFPNGFEFAGAFDLNFGDDLLSVAAQLAVPAPAGLPVGTEVYFMRKGALPDETGTWNPIWLQEESGVVGADGMIRTQSPPYPGVVRPGEYMVAYAAPTGSATLVKGKLTLNYNFPLAFFGIIIPGEKPGENFGQLVDPNYFVTTPAFSVTYDISNVQVIAVPTVGLPVVTTVGVQRNANGIATFEAQLNMPAPADSDPTAPPVLQKVELKFKDSFNQPFANNEPVVFLAGSNVLVNNSGSSLGSRFDDLIVNFHVGDRVTRGTVLPSLSRELGNNQFEVAVKVPNTVPLGSSRINLSRRQNDLVGQNRTEPVYEEVNYSSNEIRLKSGGEYVFAAQLFSDNVAVLNGSDPEAVVSAQGSNDLLLARIPVGTADRQDSPRGLAVTSDGNRVYVPLEGSSRVALVDPLVLQQVDTKPQTEDIVEPIDLPSGASPRSIVISPRDEYAYIADAKSGSIYVLDINPSSATYHQVIQTISVNPAPAGLRQLAISSDGRKLFVTAPNVSSSSKSQILVVNIDSKDRPRDPIQNLNKWHQQIGTVQADQRVEGIAATKEPTKMTFTNRRSDSTGFGVLTLTNDDPKSFAATTRYAGLNLGSIYDYFDVNEAAAVTVMRDGSLAFVAGYNGSNFGSGVESIDGVQAGSNIGIIKDPLTNPKLIAATRPIPTGFTTDLVLSNDNKYLYASYPNAGGVYVFDVEEIINTLNNPGNYVIDQLDRGIGSPFFDPNTAHYATLANLSYVPIDDINPAISIAADYEILKEDRARNQFTYGVPEDTSRGPLGTGGSPRGLAASPGDWLDLEGPIGTSSISGDAVTSSSTPSGNPLTPTFQWQFDDGIETEDVDEVNLFVSVFDEGEGLLPWDEWEALKNINNQEVLNLTPGQQQDLLSKPWQGYIDDYNPNRILTATWERNPETGLGEWVWGNGTRSLSGGNTSFTLPPELTLTASQEYNWAVEAWSKDGKRNIDFGSFWTPLTPALNGEDTFSSVSVLTHGFKPPFFSRSGIPQEFYAMADQIANAGFDGNGLIVRYDRDTGYWIPVDQNGGVLGGLNVADDNYLENLSSYISPYLERNAPLVLLTDWSQDNQSVVPDSGFTEAAADAFFASLLQLDQLLKDENSTAKQEAVFNSPLHFIGFSRGTVVNSEIIQRLGTYFPEAGGFENSGIRDLQMTMLDPHDFDQPGLSVITENFGDFREPKVQVWDNVTFADNYYQTVPNLSGGTLTPAGRDIPNLPSTETGDDKTASGLELPRQGFRSANPNPNAPLLGRPHLSVFLGTNKDNPNEYNNSRAGFTRETDPAVVIGGRGATHQRVFTWYAGTTEHNPTHFPFSEDSDSDAIYRRRGDGHYEHLFDREFSFGNTVSQPPRVSPWYTPEHRQARFQHGADNAPWEGIGTGWFYSALGGGKDLRPNTNVPRSLIPVDYDNTYDSHMRGDFPVPTLFNGNFDAVFNPQGGNRTFWSQAIPGWSLHNGETSASVSTNNLVNVNQLSVDDAPALHAELDRLEVERTQPNYALKLEASNSITHNRFIVPEWGTLRLDLHTPDGLRDGDHSDQLMVSIKGSEPGSVWEPLGEIDLRLAEDPHESDSPFSVGYYDYANGEYIDPYTYSVGYGTRGFETFHLTVPDNLNLRGKSATLRFELTQGSPDIYLDNVFFQSAHLHLGNPSDAKYSDNPDIYNRPNQRDNYLLEKPQYSLSYNDAIKGPNWVSWQLNRSWLGTIQQTDLELNDPNAYPPAGFTPPFSPSFPNGVGIPDASYPPDYFLDYPWVSDDTLPGEWVRTQGPDYRVNNRIPPFRVQRGHMTPIADRSRTFKDAYSTFLTTNVLPQNGGFNQGVWETLENQSRAFVNNVNAPRELYITAGWFGYHPERPIGSPASNPPGEIRNFVTT